MCKKLRAALIGFGGMGHFHSSCYAGQKNVELVAICDIDPEKFKQEKTEINIGESGKTALDNVVFCRSYKELISTVEFDMLDICLPCHLHAEYAQKAMKDGYHVLSEKPMARNLAQADSMIKVSQETGRKLMIAQCLRFSPAFNQLKKFYENGELGKLLRLDMRRNGSMPQQDWYHDCRKSGGALLDLHLHDTDFVNYMLGKPDAVQTYGITRESGGIDDLMTAYIYKNGPIVNSEGSWCKGSWHCSVIAVFEKATVELFNNDMVKVFHRDKPAEEIKYTEGTNMFFNEIGYFAECILGNRAPEKCLPESTRLSIRITASEERSALSRRKVNIK